MGLAVGIMWTLYIIVVFILWAIFSRFIKRRLYKNLFIAFFILLPTWDVLIQKGLKTYFELFKMEPMIYSYPQRDKNNKIESLGLINVETLIFDNFEKANEKIAQDPENFLSPDIRRNVADFIEIDSFGGYLNNKQLPNYPIKITFTKSGYSVEKLTTQKARYQIQAKIDDKLLGFYSKKDFLLVDTKTKKILAKAVAFYFPNHRWYAWFRDDVLFNGDMLGWETPPPIVCVQGDVSNLDEMLKEALNLKMYTIKHKGFKND
jgi:hypothetical protein